MPHCAAAAADIRCAGAAAGARNWTLAEHGPASAAAARGLSQVSHIVPGLLLKMKLIGAMNCAIRGLGVRLRQRLPSIRSSPWAVHSDTIRLRQSHSHIVTHHDSLKFKTLRKSVSNIKLKSLLGPTNYDSHVHC